MKISSLLGVEKNSLPLLTGTLKNLPALLHFDEEATKLIIKEVEKVFLFDTIRIGQADRAYKDILIFSSTAKCHKLTIKIDYGKSNISMAFSVGLEDFRSTWYSMV